MVGRILSAFGVRGWVKVKSDTDPPDNILKYSPWIVGLGEAAREYDLVDGKHHGETVVARLEGIADRDQALLLAQQQIAVHRHQFPDLKRGQFYWADLIGLEVRTETGLVLGTLSEMMETGANDVMEVVGDRSRLIPFVVGEYVKTVNLDEGFLIVDWDPDF